MTTWTDDASECLERYLRQVDATMIAEERDAARVVAALRGAIAHHAMTLGETPISVGSIRRILARIGEPELVAQTWLRAHVEYRRGGARVRNAPSCASISRAIA